METRSSLWCAISSHNFRGLEDFDAFPPNSARKLRAPLNRGGDLMVARAGSQILAAAAFAVLAAVVGLGAGPGVDSAYAQDATCLASPNGPAPAGTHWFYRTDPTTQRKCWYTRSPEQAAQGAPTETPSSQAPSTRTAPSRGAPMPLNAVNPDSDAATAPDEPTAPAALAPAAMPVPASERLPPAATTPRRPTTGIARIPMPAADPRGEPQPIAMATAAPNPVAAAAPSDGVVWPDPPKLTAPGNGVSTSPAAMSFAPASPAPDAPTASDSPPTTGSTPPEGSGQSPTATQAAPAPDGVASKPAGDTPASAKPPGRVPIIMLLAGLVVLLAAGMLVRRIVERALGRRRRNIKVARHEPRLVEPVAVPPPMPALLRHAPSVVPGRADAEQRVNEVEDALRRFAQNLRHGRPAANGTQGRTGTWAR